MSSNVHRWLAPPVFLDQPLNLQSSILNILILLIVTIWLAVMFLQILLGQVVSWNNIWLSMLVIALLLVARIWMHSGHYWPAALLLPLLSYAITTIQITNLGTITTFHLAGYLLVTVLATLLLGPRAGLVFALLSFTTTGLLAAAETAQAFTRTTVVSPYQQLFIFLTLMGFTYSVVSMVRKTLIDSLNKAHREVNQRQQAEEALRQLNASLDQRVSERTRELEAVIEKQQQTELALRASEEKFRTLIDFTQDWEYWLGPDGSFLYVSPSCQQIAGYPASDYLADSSLFERVLHPDDRPLYREHIQHPDRTKAPCKSLTFRIYTQNGEERWISHVCRPIHSRTGKYLGQRASNREITEIQLMNNRLQRQNELFSALHRSTLTFLQYRSLPELLQSLVDHATRLLDAPFGEIDILQGEELVVQAVSANQADLINDRTNREQPLLAWQAIDTRQAAVMDDYSSWECRRDIFDPLGLRAVAELPIIVGDAKQCLGVLSLARSQANRPFSPEEIQVGMLFAQIAGLAIENTQLQSNLSEQSFRDPLTGLHNRRYLFDTLLPAFANDRRAQTPLSFILLDIDHFKDLNDRFGHGCGDAVLCALADRFKNMVRSGDILCRYGGDEHIIVLYNTPGDVARTRAEEWRLAIEGMAVPYGGLMLSCTISIGVAVYPEHGDSIDEVISRADRALYFAKNHGRNQVILFSNP